jgi:VanZ family protein
MRSGRHRSSAVPLAAAYALLVLYASLYPFTDWRWPPGQDMAALLALTWPPWRHDFDTWSNWLGYLPLGALLYVGARRSGLGAVRSLLLALALPAGLSYGTEVLQQFLPGRHPSLKDWALNTTGAASGVAVALAGQALGLDTRWHALRQRWFGGDGAGALALLVLWPVALLFPAPAPLGLGQLGPPLRDAALAWVDGVAWAEPLQSWLLPSGASTELGLPAAGLPPLGEASITALGLLGPCLLAYAVMAPGWRRLAALVALLAVGTGGAALSTALNYGPEHALAWLTPATLPGLMAGSLAALLLVPAGRRLSAALALMALTGGVALVAQAPADPYFAQTLQAWEQGRFVRFHGVAQWLGWLWPFAAMGWLLTRLASRQLDSGR